MFTWRKWNAFFMIWNFTFLTRDHIDFLSYFAYIAVPLISDELTLSTPSLFTIFFADTKFFFWQFILWRFFFLIFNWRFLCCLKISSAFFFVSILLLFCGQVFLLSAQFLYHVFCALLREYSSYFFDVTVDGIFCLIRFV